MTFPKKLLGAAKLIPTIEERLVTPEPETAAKENPLAPKVFNAPKLPLYQPVPVAITLPHVARDVPSRE